MLRLPALAPPANQLQHHKTASDALRVPIAFWPSRLVSPSNCPRDEVPALQTMILALLSALLACSLLYCHYSINPAANPSTLLLEAPCLSCFCTEQSKPPAVLDTSTSTAKATSSLVANALCVMGARDVTRLLAEPPAGPFQSPIRLKTLIADTSDHFATCHRHATVP